MAINEPRSYEELRLRRGGEHILWLVGTLWHQLSRFGEETLWLARKKCSLRSGLLGQAVLEMEAGELLHTFRGSI